MQKDKYKEQDFKLPKMEGFSIEQIDEHIKLYKGYVKNVNELIEDLETLEKENNARIMSELKRRLSFEWNGMRLHEYYFEEMGGDGTINKNNSLVTTISSHFGSLDSWISEFKKIGSMRGIGWVLLCYDKKENRLFNIWINDHEIGHLAGTSVIFAMDVWEHAYLIDYLPSERGKYIDAFFNVLKWDKIEERYKGVINNK